MKLQFVNYFVTRAAQISQALSQCLKRIKWNIFYCNPYSHDKTNQATYFIWCFTKPIFMEIKAEICVSNICVLFLRFLTKKNCCLMVHKYFDGLQKRWQASLVFNDLLPKNFILTFPKFGITRLLLCFFWSGW
jgi:hypothetical protein